MPASNQILVHAALICRDLKKDENGIHILGIVDAFTFQVAGHVPPAPWPNAEVAFIAYFSLRCRSSRPAQTARVELVSPTGGRRPFPEFQLEFPDAVSIAFHRLDVTFQTNVEGVYWLELLSEGELLAATVFRVFFRATD